MKSFTPSDKENGMQAIYAVIIPHYNDSVRLHKCLSALFEGHSVEDFADTEVYVVDNNSSEILDSIKAAFPLAQFRTETKKGAAAARNRGVEETDASYLFFLDADCVPATDWLAAAKVAVRTGDIIGGHVGTFDETPAPRSGAEAFETVFAFKQEAYVKKKGFSVTANLLMARSVFEEVGNFINGVSEDVDWCWRARAKKFELIFDPSVRVMHPTRSDWPALKKKWRRMLEEGFALNGKDPVSRMKWLLRATVIFLSPFAHAPRVLMSPALEATAERWHGLLTLFRLRFWRGAFMAQQALFKA